MLDRVEVEVKRYDGTTYPETYVRTDLYCPNCGKQTVWTNGDDYYCGAQGYCLSCGKYHDLAGEFYDIEGDSILAIEIIKYKLEEENAV